MTTGPCVIGTAQLEGHRDDPCRLLIFADFGACSPRPEERRSWPHLEGWGHAWPHGSRRAGRPDLRRSSLADFAGIVTCRLLRFKCPPPLTRGPANADTRSGHRLPSDDPALLRIDGPIATITLNRPGAFNSIDLSIAKKLEQLGAEVEANDDIRVLVIEGEGRAFSAGGDLQTIGAAAEADTIAPVVGELLKHYHAFIETVRRMPKIVLSSVHGSAAGAGMGLAFVADLCIAADDARFTPAYAKIGVSPDGGSTVGMVGTVGVRRALQIFLAEDSFSAQQAYDWGLVAKVVPAAELKAADAKIRRAAGAKSAGRHRAAPSRWSTRPRSPRPSSSSMPRKPKIIDAMQTEEFRAAVKKFTSKSKA